MQLHLESMGEMREGRLCKVNRFRGLLIWCCSAIRSGGPGGTLAIPVSQFDRLLGRAYLLLSNHTSKRRPWQAKFIQYLFQQIIESFDERLPKASVNTGANCLYSLSNKPFRTMRRITRNLVGCSCNQHCERN